jgi:MtN3 and saliva related transmembrane protein
MNLMDLLGIIAGMLTTASFVPQVLQTHRSKSAKDVSLGMLVVLVAGVSLWIVYGILVWSLPVILANSCTFVLVTVLIALKVKYG